VGELLNIDTGPSGRMIRVEDSDDLKDFLYVAVYGGEDIAALLTRDEVIALRNALVEFRVK
jgi:hypothetical protein